MSDILCDKKDPLIDDIAVLTENDIPGSSLNGKLPVQLNVKQLKRWLSCCGAPISGKKNSSC